MNLPPSRPSERARILLEAREQFFVHGFHGVTMDQLARDLGMSKKTLYRHFPSKDALLDGVIDTVAGEVGATLEAVSRDRRSSCSEKLLRIAAGIGGHLSPIQPVFLASLRRFAPAQLERIEQVRRRNIETHLLPLLRAGGRNLRPGIDPVFVVELLLQTLDGILKPDLLQRLERTPAQAVSEALDLLFHGILGRSAGPRGLRGKSRSSRRALTRNGNSAPGGRTPSARTAAPVQLRARIRSQPRGRRSRS